MNRYIFADADLIPAVLNDGKICSLAENNVLESRSPLLAFCRSYTPSASSLSYLDTQAQQFLAMTIEGAVEIPQCSFETSNAYYPFDILNNKN